MKPAQVHKINNSGNSDIHIYERTSYTRQGNAPGGSATCSQGLIADWLLPDVKYFQYHFFTSGLIQSPARAVE